MARQGGVGRGGGGSCRIEEHRGQAYVDMGLSEQEKVGGM